MAGMLTTHVLDTSMGCPAAGLQVDLYRIEDGVRTLVRSSTTNSDGRTDGPLLPQEVFRKGVYEIVFHAGGYLQRIGATVRQPSFLDEIPIRFGMSEEQHYHVPLLLSPFGYSTYRGS
ncbi:MAG: hydroxyisourate hydrolase [Rhodobacteraceae bacterium]|nr:hydroxyisourate hydrolase [Paracoccaceae bacterium]